MFIYRQGWNYSHSWTGPIAQTAQDEITFSSGGTPQVLVLPSARATSEASHAALRFSIRWTQSVEVTKAPRRTTIHPREARRSRYTHRTSGSRSSTHPSTSLVLRRAHTRTSHIHHITKPSVASSPSPQLSSSQ